MHKPNRCTRSLSWVTKLLSVTILGCSNLALCQVVTTSFDAPGAGTSPGQGTNPQAINESGQITGIVTDSNWLSSGFVRNPDSTVVTFDPSGDGTTQPIGINASGQVTGTFQPTGGGNYVGFIRNQDGSVTTFQVAPLMQSAGINDTGQVTGIYYDSGRSGHGFVRDQSGNLQLFDVPGAGTSAEQGTYPTRINLGGTVMGSYTDAARVTHGFVRKTDGSIVTFNAPGTGDKYGHDTNPIGFNSSGQIAGYYYYDYPSVHAFFRDADGTITTFDVPGASMTVALSINSNGQVAGIYYDKQGNHCFAWDRLGNMTEFDAAGAAKGKTGCVDLNSSLQIAGGYVDANNVGHGFLGVLNGYFTKTSVASNPNPSIYGQAITITATVTSEGPTTPTGSVTFSVGKKVVGASSLSGGTAHLTTAKLLAGTDVVVAQYDGGNGLLPSRAAVAQVVQAASTSIALTSSQNPSSYGQPVTVTATVTAQTGVVPAGKVTFSAGSNVVGTLSLRKGVATLTTSSLPVGSTVITAAFSGPNFLTSTTQLTQVVN
jgi:hypothetical protein